VRIGHILSLLEEKDLFDSTLFVVTSDHGMAAADVSLKGNPARIPERSGTAAVTTEPCIYLRDLAIEIEVAADGRTALATVLDNDLNSTGERPPVGGTCGLAIPADLEPADLVAAVTANGFNGQRIRLDGEAGTTFDLRETLYG
ncbi:MAG: alkaline phosphatase family protein, partial [Dehalococcoidia bacterium]